MGSRQQVPGTPGQIEPGEPRQIGLGVRPTMLVPGRSYDGRVTDPTPPRMRIRWEWILGCILLGFAAIAAGFGLLEPAGRRAYVASVLAGIGTTLLLVGIVVLLERRIVDTAAKAVRRVVATERVASDARIKRLTEDLEERLSAEWARGDVDDVETLKRRTAELTQETIARIEDEATGSARLDRSDGA